MKNCPSLYKIKLEHNLIDNFDNLKCLSKYNIKKINLEGNPLVSTNENYRDELFKLVPSLEVIDGINKQGNEVDSTLYGDEEDDDGEYEDGEEVGDISEDDEEGDEEDDDEGGDDEGDEDDDDEDAPQKKRKD